MGHLRSIPAGTHLPAPPEFNPLGVTVDSGHPTEVPDGDWDLAVFDNRFPSLSLSSAPPPSLIVPTASAVGTCEVVVFTKDAHASLGALPLAHIDLLLQVWADRTRRLAERSEIAYVLPFENRGAEVGVTLHHPHGQIYAYPVVPPVPARMQQEAQSVLPTERTRGPARPYRGRARRAHSHDLRGTSCSSLCAGVCTVSL